MMPVIQMQNVFVIARSDGDEAIQLPAQAIRIASLTLAMTMGLVRPKISPL
jgi:hypothetical protein